MALDKLVDSTQLDGALEATADAIRAKAGSSAAIAWDADEGFKEAIEAIPTSGGSSAQPLTITKNGTYTAPTGTSYSPVTVDVPTEPFSFVDTLDENGGAIRTIITNRAGVRFVDYDGTLLHFYNVSEMAAMTELPENPTHEGLTAQGWNWTLAEIKSYLTNYPQATVVVGQMYITDDGNTRLYIHLENSERLDVSVYYYQSVAGGVKINFGDSELWFAAQSSGHTNMPHSYSEPGDYVIKLSVAEGTCHFGRNTAGINILGPDHGACSALRKLEIGSGVVQTGNNGLQYLFELESITMPQTLTTLGSSFMSYCYKLKHITLPRGIITITGYGVYNCYNLRSVSIPYGVTTLQNNCFYNDNNLEYISIPDSVTTIGSSIFQVCTKLSSIIFPDSITSVGNAIARGCNNAKYIRLPKHITDTKENLLYSCYTLQHVSMPEDITNIGSSMFVVCENLRSIDIPKNVTTISTNAFYQCYTLQRVTIPDGVTSIGNSAFYQCTSMTEIEIPDSVLTIGTGAFTSCSTLAHVTLPSEITSITDNMFINCYHLLDIEIPADVTSIGSSAFKDCKSLKTMIIPSGVASIGAEAFSGCVNMKEYHLLPATPPTLANADAFTGIPSGCVIYVPTGSLSAYQTASNWSTYASYMQEE